VANAFAMVREKKLPFVIGEFGCTHGSQKPVACEAIMAEASRGERQYGYIGWSFSGNDSSLQDLDIVESRDWSTLTAWGRTLINNPSGIKATAREACFFRSPLSCSN
jgi:mannan endo-1,4-beta-mannosidase